MKNRFIGERYPMKNRFIGERYPMKIVLNCKNLKILRDFYDFDSYISYRGSLRAERPARRGFARSQGKTGFRLFICSRFPVSVIPVQSRLVLEVQVLPEVAVVPLYQDTL